MENNDLQKTAKDNKEFIFGLTAGVAVVSTVALVGLLIYIFTGGRFTGLTGGSNTGGTNGKVAKNFEACLTSGKNDAVIKADQDLGLQLGVQGTPASFVNGYLVSGALPFEAFQQLIDTLKAGKTPDFDFLKDPNTKKVVKVDMPAITAADHVTGAKNGPITIVLFSDFECPFCGRHEATVSQILKAYPNDVTLVFKHFPLSFHQYAKPAAIASECANDQGKFWEMHDKLFELNVKQALNTASISQAAVDLGLK